MKLKRLTCSQGGPIQSGWRLETISFQDINLIVGENATGKTRILNVMGKFAKLLRGETNGVGTGSILAEFKEDENRFAYLLESESALIRKESFSLNDDHQ